MLNLDILEKISATTKRLEKEQLLGSINESTKDLIRWSLDPLITFGVTVDEEEILRGYIGGSSEDNWLPRFEDLLKRLSDRSLTGNNALYEMNKVLTLAPDKNHCAWGARVLNKDLRAGLHLKTVNKIFPGLINEFLVCLAKEFEPDKHLPIEGHVFVEPKLDGLRMIVYQGKAYTRTGVLLTSVDHIIEQLSNLVNLNDFVFDGEVMGDAADFDSASGKIRQQKGTNEGTNYHIFDMICTKEWDDKSTGSLVERKVLLSNLHLSTPQKSLRIVPWVTVENPDFSILEQLRDEHIANGYEGAMIKDPLAPYQFKRSDKLLKLKNFMDLDGTVVDTFEGKGKHKGRLGGFKVLHDGVITEVGSGFTDAERENFWAGKENILNKTVTIKYQNKTKNGVLRFPVFQKIRIDK